MPIEVKIDFVFSKVFDEFVIPVVKSCGASLLLILTTNTKRIVYFVDDSLYFCAKTDGVVRFKTPCSVVEHKLKEKTRRKIVSSYKKIVTLDKLLHKKKFDRIIRTLALKFYFSNEKEFNELLKRFVVNDRI